MNQKSKKLTRTDFALAEKLCTLHKDNSFNKEIPEYSYEKLRKGLICSECGKYEYIEEGRFFKCNQCHRKISTSEIVLRQIEELEVLFPKQPLTIGLVKSWCKGAVSSYKIRDVLKTNFKMNYLNKQTYYS